MKYLWSVYAGRGWLSIRRSLSVGGWWRLGPADAFWLSALRAVAGALTLLVLAVLTGHVELAASAMFGGLTAVHGRFDPFGVRGRVLAAVGAGLVLAVSIGALAAAFHASPILIAVLVALVAAAAKLLTDAIELGPPGGLVFVFAITTTAILPLQRADVGWQVGAAALGAVIAWTFAMAGRVVDPLGPIRLAVARALDAVDRSQGKPHLAVSAIEGAWRALGTVRRSSDQRELLAIELASAEAVLYGDRLPDDDLRARSRLLRKPVNTRLVLPAPAARYTAFTRSPDTPPRWWPRIRTACRPGSPEFARSARVLVGALGTGLLAQALSLGHPYWATVAAAAVLQSTTVRHTAQRAVQRGFGTMAGVLLAAGLLALHLPEPWLLMTIVASMLGAELTVMRNYALAMLFLTPLTLLLSVMSGASGQPGLVPDRLLNTVLGAAVGVLVAFLIPTGRPLSRLREAISRAQRAADTFDGSPAARREATAAAIALRQAWDTVGHEPEDPESDGVACEHLVVTLEQRCYRLIARTSPATMS